MVSAKKTKYNEGTLCAVPIDQNSYALGLVARCKPENNGILGYFFARVFQKIPTLEELTELSAREAVLVLRVSDYGIVKKRWPIIGQLNPWDRTKWPTPRFYRKDLILGIDWEVLYDDNDIDKCIKQTKIRGRTEDMSDDGSFGWGLVEQLLFDRLVGSR